MNIVTSNEIAAELSITIQRVGQLVKIGSLPEPRRIGQNIMLFPGNWREYYEQHKPRSYKRRERQAA